MPCGKEQRRRRTAPFGLVNGADSRTAARLLDGGMLARGRRRTLASGLAALPAIFLRRHGRPQPCACLCAMLGKKRTERKEKGGSGRRPWSRWPDLEARRRFVAKNFMRLERQERLKFKRNFPLKLNAMHFKVRVIY